ncbi:MAG: hypothetical protein GY822_31750 [Deltaproteobacteria bacterium]|nr:hypothetical protein [Deltaproteobacteria bacterium]
MKTEKAEESVVEVFAAHERRTPVKKRSLRNSFSDGICKPPPTPLTNLVPMT